MDRRPRQYNYNNMEEFKSLCRALYAQRRANARQQGNNGAQIQQGDAVVAERSVAAVIPYEEGELDSKQHQQQQSLQEPVSATDIEP